MRSRRISIPGKLIPYTVSSGQIVPFYLHEADHPWLRELLDAFAASEGLSCSELDRRLRAHEQPGQKKKALAMHVLKQMLGFRVEATRLPVDLRLPVFVQAARHEDPRDALPIMANRFSVSCQELLASLFADLPAEQRLRSMPDDLHPAGLAMACNLAVAQAVLRHSQALTVHIHQQSRLIVKMVKLLGLMCQVLSYSPGQGTWLRITGPLAVLQQTQRYGSLLAQLLPLLPWCGVFKLQAKCRIGNQSLNFLADHRDPLPAAKEPRRYDSKVEEALVRDLSKLAPEVSIIREPTPLRVGSSWMFPDFLIQDWYVEIVGFWTQSYLEKKLSQVRQVSGSQSNRWILCVAENNRHQIQVAMLPTTVKLVWYGRRVSAAGILAVLNEE